MRPTANHVDVCTNCSLPECDEDNLECVYMRPYRDKANAQTKLYFLKHPELRKQMDKKYYNNNKDKILIQKKEYYKKNRERILKEKQDKGNQLREEIQNLRLLICLILINELYSTRNK